MPDIDEFSLQRAFVIWLEGSRDRRTGAFRIPPALAPGVEFWHTPNGGARSGVEAKRFKEMGVRAGIPDLFFLRPTRFDCGVFGLLYAMEWKKPGEGRLSNAQKDMHPRLMRSGLAGLITIDNLADAKAWAFQNMLTVCIK